MARGVGRGRLIQIFPSKVGGGGVIIRGTAIIRENTVNEQTYDTSLTSTPSTGLKGVCLGES